MATNLENSNVVVPVETVKFDQQTFARKFDNHEKIWYLVNTCKEAWKMSWDTVAARELPAQDFDHIVLHNMMFCPRVSSCRKKLLSTLLGKDTEPSCVRFCVSLN